MRNVIPAGLGLAALLLGACASGPPPEPVEVGLEVEPFTFHDQHGDARRFDASIRLVLFSRDMDGGAIIRDTLAADPGFLKRHKAVYVSDISRMPGAIRRFVVMPRLRKRPYVMFLDKTGEVTAGLPSEDNKATLIFMKRLTVNRIEYADSIAALRTTVGDPAEPPAPEPAAQPTPEPAQPETGPAETP
jgi:hypothetical protein